VNRTPLVLSVLGIVTIAELGCSPTAPAPPAAPSNAAAPRNTAASSNTAAPSNGSAPVKPAAPEPIAWPLAEGWRREVIPFPLDFAPALSYRGAEIIRFAPRFFDAAAPTYFSYAFVWALEGSPALDAAALEPDLARYFAGLCKEVGGTKFSFDPSHFRARLATAVSARTGARALAGTVDTYDPFGDGRPLTLNVRIEVWDCPAPGPRVAAFAASPAAATAPVWRDLEARLAEVRCK